eukprot:3371877-Amphidinium_carterae.1
MPRSTLPSCPRPFNTAKTAVIFSCSNYTTWHSKRQSLMILTSTMAILIKHEDLQIVMVERGN